LYLLKKKHKTTQRRDSILRLGKSPKGTLHGWERDLSDSRSKERLCEHETIRKRGEVTKKASKKVGNKQVTLLEKNQLKLKKNVSIMGI